MNSTAAPDGPEKADADAVPGAVPVSSEASGQWPVVAPPSPRFPWGSAIGVGVGVLVVGMGIGALAVSSYYERQPTTSELRLRVARLKSDLRAAADERATLAGEMKSQADELARFEGALAVDMKPEEIAVMATRFSAMEQFASELQRANDDLRRRLDRLQTRLARLQAGPGATLTDAPMCRADTIAVVSGPEDGGSSCGQPRAPAFVDQTGTRVYWSVPDRDGVRVCSCEAW